MNSPKEIVSFIEPVVEGKVFCDLGCNNGEFLSYFGGCKSRIGIDFHPENCEEARRKGIERVECHNFFKRDLPEADIYYSFTHLYDNQAIYNLIPEGRTIIFGAPKERFDKEENPRFIKEHQSRIDIPFKEGSVYKNAYKNELKEFIWSIAIIRK